MKRILLVLTPLLGASDLVFSATSDEPKAHPLTVHNGSGDGDYVEGENVTITGTRPPADGGATGAGSNDWVFIRWIKTEGGGKIENPGDETTKLTMPNKKTVVVAVYGKINAWFPPGKESSNKGFLLPKDPKAQKQSRLEHRTRVTISIEEGSDDLPHQEVWDQIGVSLGWFPSQKCEGIWHSSELLKYWDKSAQGTEIMKDGVVPKSLFEEKSQGVYEASVWYEGNWTMDQLPSKVDKDDTPVMPEALTGFGMVIHATNYSNTRQGTHGRLVPVDLAVDANRDGTICFAGNYQSTQGKPTDTTTETKPFRFWVNDDNDGLPNAEGEAVGTGTSDYEDGVIQTARDLEDFARLYVHIGGLYEEIANGTFKIGLKWRNTDGTAPKIKVYKSTDSAGSDSYLKEDTAAFAQVSGDDAEMLGEVSGEGELILDREGLWSGYSEANPKLCLLFEGSGEGKGQLCITIHKADGAPLGDGPRVWLDIKNIKKMYVRGHTQPDFQDRPFDHFDAWSPPLLRSEPYTINQPFSKPVDEESTVVVYVHGINGPLGQSSAYENWQGDSETVFKRLWHQGFKGRFASFKWLALTSAFPFNFNESEYRGWKSGQALAQFLGGFPANYTRNLYSFSQGAVVCGSALTTYGASVRNYVISQGALPAGCYDPSEEANSYDRFLRREQTLKTPDSASDLGYRNCLAGLNVTGQTASFFNAGDFALKTGVWNGLDANWEANQLDYKPNGFQTPPRTYVYDPDEMGNPRPVGERCFLRKLVSQFNERRLSDVHESMSFVARPRSEAVGARAQVAGKVNTLPFNVGEGSASNFGPSQEDHSGQFAHRIQQTQDYYRQLGLRLGVLNLQQ